MGAVRDLVNELRRRGVTVHEWQGWEGRGNENVREINPKGAILHHTGTDYGFAFPGLVSSTRPDLLGGVLANFAGNVDGSLTVLASGLAWHAGGGYGPNQGPLAPYANNRNYYTVGLEIVYPGSSPMTDAQYRTALVFSKAVADLFAGGNMEYIRAHAEVNGKGYLGKWDPGYAPGLVIDMNRFRQEALSASTGDDVNLDDTFRTYNGEDWTVRQFFQYVESALRDLYELENNDTLPVFDKVEDGVDRWVLDDGKNTRSGTHFHAKKGHAGVDELRTVVSRIEREVAALQTGTGYTLDQIADAVANKLAERLDM